MQAERAEGHLANELLGDDDDDGAALKAVNLNSEKDYKEFGKNVGAILLGGKAPYRIENFYKELSKDLGKHLDSKQIKKISDSLQSIYNMKLQEEK